jgi:nucleoid DNA-binding protein
MALTMMSQVELVEELAERTGWTKSDVRHALAELTEIVVENAKNCVRTKVAGVVIEPKLRKKTKARMGRNPQTGDPVKIGAKPASVKVKAKIVKPLSDAVPSVKKLQNAL